MTRFKLSCFGFLFYISLTKSMIWSENVTVNTVNGVQVDIKEKRTMPIGVRITTSNGFKAVEVFFFPVAIIFGRYQ